MTNLRQVFMYSKPNLQQTFTTLRAQPTQFLLLIGWRLHQLQTEPGDLQRFIGCYR